MPANILQSDVISYLMYLSILLPINLIFTQRTLLTCTPLCQLKDYFGERTNCVSCNAKREPLKENP